MHRKSVLVASGFIPGAHRRRRRCHRLRAIALTALGFAPLAPTRAGPVTYEFQGIVDLVSDPNNLLGVQVPVGSSFFLEYLFDPTTPPFRPGEYRDPILAISGRVGALEFDGGLVFGSNIFVENSTSGGDNDAYHIHAFGMNTPGLGEPSSVSLLFFDQEGVALSSDSLLTSLDPTRFDSSTFSFFSTDHRRGTHHWLHT
jgi:hypothetical protein